MNTFTSLPPLAQIVIFLCVFFLGVLAIYITWIVPVRVVSLLTDLLATHQANLAEARKQTELLREANAFARASADRAEKAELAEIAEAARRHVGTSSA